MNSFNHYSFGAIGQWLFSNAAGIDLDTPGFKRMVIRPEIGGTLTHIEAGYESIRGRIAVSWRRSGAVDLKVTIPANTTALIYVPASKSSRITEGGLAAESARGLRLSRREADYTLFEAESGRYAFRVE